MGTRRRRPSFEIAWQPATTLHLDVLPRRDLGAVRDAVVSQLSHEPFTETRNRKPMLRESPFGSQVWEIRFGQQNRLRVFYCRDPESPRRVLIEAVGVKERSKLRVGGVEVTYAD